MRIEEFQSIVWQYYHTNARILPWRIPETNGKFNPYYILVSEIMLQQTQVSRVAGKYVEFIKYFPNIESLASADLKKVLEIWSGLGYNRRAKYLHEAAKKLTQNSFPNTTEQLTAFKGIGQNTASAVIVYSYNHPLPFIETNIRTVYLHHFFKKQQNVDDKQILHKVKQTISETNPREWYWALMDYGSYLKASGIKNTSLSKHYKKQSTFTGSKRQVRGRIIKELISVKNPINATKLQKIINDSRFQDIINDLSKEELIIIEDSNISLP